MSLWDPEMLEIDQVMKFLCKDMWVNCFGKQVDNLRTNHQASESTVGQCE